MDTADGEQIHTIPLSEVVAHVDCWFHALPDG